MAVVQVSVVPLGTESPSLSRYVANCQKILAGYPELQHQLCPMGTVIEGDLDLILRAIREMHESPFAKGAQRVATFINIDDRRDKTITMKGKIKSVENKLAQL
ncbi:MTH1187 family thiamine-binding protein [bacterium]|nr:MTH1187 family thiamine-binding protein [bacterium]